MATCLDKKEYVVHFAALKVYLKYGLVITKMHRVIKFTQAPLFRDYIDYNSARRQEATNDFQKDFYKQKNNKLFGKSLENKRNRYDIILCNSHHQLLKAASNNRFNSAIAFNDKLVAAELTKGNTTLDAPIAIGAAVLDINKTIMYSLVYDEFPKYEKLFNCNLTTVGGDTDSLFFEVQGVDLINVLYPKMLEDGLLDTSNYNKQHPLYSEAHRAQLGCVKDEFEGKVCKEFVLLRPKSYSMKTIDSYGDKRKSKGVAKRKIALLVHDDYKKVFCNQCEISTNCRRMQSIKHIVYNVNQYKIALSYADDKRAWFSNNFSLPYGHWLSEHFENNPPTDVDIDMTTKPRTIEQLYNEIYTNDVEMC